MQSPQDNSQDQFSPFTLGSRIKPMSPGLYNKCFYPRGPFSRPVLSVVQWSIEDVAQSKEIQSNSVGEGLAEHRAAVCLYLSRPGSKEESWMQGHVVTLQAWLTSSSQAGLLKVPCHPENSTSQGPSVQTCRPMGDTLHPDQDSRFGHIDQAGLEPATHLPQSSECWSCSLCHHSQLVL